MQLATDLVAGQFKDDKDARLERIVLAGKTTALQQVRDALSTRFGKTINWDATGVTVESRYAKLATAIGACWAESVRQFAFDPEGAVRQLREGKTVLDVDIDNLFFTLPCTFAFRELEAYAARIPSGGAALPVGRGQPGQGAQRRPLGGPTQRDRYRIPHCRRPQRDRLGRLRQSPRLHQRA